jgi:hypothetical protein
MLTEPDATHPTPHAVSGSAGLRFFFRPIRNPMRSEAVQAAAVE